MHEITINSTILDRIEWAEQCYDVLGSQFIGDEKIRNLLTLYKNAIMSSSREMVKTGLVEKCRDCEERDGGSCCGKGLENHYSGVMLLINLLLGRKLGKERYDAKGCLFLGENGCNLLKASTTFSFSDGIMKLKAAQRWLSWGFAKLCFLIFPICTKIKLA